jgi:O-antigen ligase
MKPIRIGICALIAFAVLAHGAVEVWSSTTLEIGAAVLFVAWGVISARRQNVEVRWNWLCVPLLLFGAFALLQRLAGLSVNPYATQLELLKAGAYFLLFFLTIESFHDIEEWKSFVWFLIILGFLVSLLAIVQYFTSNGKLYWFRTLAAGVVPFGPFVNRNHFAGFVELTIPFGIALLLSSAVRKDKLPLLVVLTIVPIGALALSASRGGIVTFGFQFLLLTALLRKTGSRKVRLAFAGGLILVAALLAVWLGLGRTVQRFEHSTPGDISNDRRVSIFKDALKMIRDHPVAGTGLGTFETVYPRYESFYDGLIVDHAHNDYLELLAETGLIGGACIAVFIVLLAWRGFSNLRSAKGAFERSVYAGSLVACAGLLLHSMVDFNFHIPSNALLFLLLAAMATSDISGSRRSYPQQSTASRGFALDRHISPK